MFTKYKKLIITIIVIVGLFLAYSIFFGGNLEREGLLRSSVSTTSQTSTDILGEEIIRAINQISSLKLDDSVFDNPVFRRLVDRSERIEPEDPGRDNPFAPIDVSLATQARGDASTEELPEPQD